jgi:Fusaric acid resistance protein-like
VRARLTHLRSLAPTLVLGAFAAALAWWLAKGLVGERNAFFAPIAAIITLGLAAGQRLHRAIELSAGVAFGIALADVLVLALGSGTLQLAAITFVVMSTAVLVGAGPLAVTQSAVSAILVVTLQPPTHGLNFTREADALIGCGIVVLLNFLIFPLDPVALVRREAQPVLRELAAVLDDLAAALETRDREAAVAALRRARGIDAHTQRFLDALTVGRETAAAAPPRRAAREPLELYSAAGAQIDLAVRDVRVLARGAQRAIELDDEIPHGLTVAMRELADAVRALIPWLADEARAGEVRDAAVGAARRASDALEEASNLSASAIVGQVRSTAVDLLRTTGIEPAEARALVRGVAA